MRQVKEYRKELKQGGTPSTYIDIDGIAEVCDCLRGAGLTEASDPMLCEGTLFMLSMQRKHGDWPAIMFGDNTPEASLDYYHRIHPTWVCTQSLRDRDFKIGAGANMFWCAPFTAAVHRPPRLTAHSHLRRAGRSLSPRSSRSPTSRPWRTSLRGEHLGSRRHIFTGLAF